MALTQRCLGSIIRSLHIRPGLRLFSQSHASRGRVVLVSGGAKGIGLGICESFMNKEPDVVVACLDTDVTAGQALETKYPNLSFWQTDVSQKDQVQEAVADIHSKFGSIDVLVNNAAIQPYESCVPIHELSDEWWNKLLQINLYSVFYLSREVIPLMMSAQKPGVVLNIASIQGVQSQEGVPAYAATKGALLSLTRQMALDYAKHNIRVLAINPGTIRTELVQALLKSQGVTPEEAGKPYPLKRIGEPSEVGDVAVFLASDGASFMTGSSVFVDGGIVQKGGWV